MERVIQLEVGANRKQSSKELNPTFKKPESESCCQPNKATLSANKYNMGKIQTDGTISLAESCNPISHSDRSDHPSQKDTRKDEVKSV